jgi:hypothetical protein
MIYEHHNIRPISHADFITRMVRHGALALFLTLFSIGLGMAGYAYFENLPWRDAFVNAAMLMGGMGPVDMPKTDGGKLFAGLYALYAGMVYLAIAGVLLVPVIHRVLHRFHWEEKKKRGEDS